MPNEYEENIAELRKRYDGALNFAVGDVHGQYETLKALMGVIGFDPQKDHVYFVGDYNAGGNVRATLSYMSDYFQADYKKPGFHMIRGNHERELYPQYPLENLPDIIVIKTGVLTYYIAHAGMMADVFALISQDISSEPTGTVLAYKLDDVTVQFDAPFRQIIWSRRGLYSHKSRWNCWPSEDALLNNAACIIHGHTPYGFLLNKGPGYGENNCFLEKQHIWFSEDLHSFNIDSNAKNRAEGGPYSGLACVCLEALNETVYDVNCRQLTIDGVEKKQDAFFSQDLLWNNSDYYSGDVTRILTAAPIMKTIGISADGKACFL